MIKTSKSASNCPSCKEMNKPKCDKISDTIQNSKTNPCTELVLDNLNTDVKYINEPEGGTELSSACAFLYE